MIPESPAATPSPIEKMLDDAYDRGGWPEARRYAVSLHAAAKSGVLTTLAALDALVADGIPYEDARRLVDQAREMGKAIRDAHTLKALASVYTTEDEDV